MSKRGVWLALGVLSVGFVFVSCTGTDGTASFDATGGDGAGGDDPSGAGSSSKAGTKNTGGSNGDAGSTGAAAAGPVGGQGSGEAGSSGTGEGGSSSNAAAGQAGGGGDATFGGAPGGDAGAPGSDAGAGGAGPEGKPCESVKSCDEGELCLKPSCGKEEAEGVCTKAGKAPVCGCDGTTYFNGALARSEGVDIRGQGACKGESATACDGECKGDDLYCGAVELRGGSCETKAGGVCWRLPAECPKIDPTLYNLCGSEKCLPLCEAVQEGVHAVPGALACPALQ